MTTEKEKKKDNGCLGYITTGIGIFILIAIAKDIDKMIRENIFLILSILSLIIGGAIIVYKLYRDDKSSIEKIVKWCLGIAILFIVFHFISLRMVNENISLSKDLQEYIKEDYKVKYGEKYDEIVLKDNDGNVTKFYLRNVQVVKVDGAVIIKCIKPDCFISDVSVLYNDDGFYINDTSPGDMLYKTLYKMIENSKKLDDE